MTRETINVNAGTIICRCIELRRLSTWVLISSICVFTSSISRSMRCMRSTSSIRKSLKSRLVALFISVVSDEEPDKEPEDDGIDYQSANHPAHKADLRFHLGSLLAMLNSKNQI